MSKYIVEIDKEDRDINTIALSKTLTNNFNNLDYKISKVDSIQKMSDGYHTFEELYHHRMMLFSVICNTYRDKAWKSWKHNDNTMYDDYFIVGIDTEEGQYTYHYHKDNWDMFNVKELEYAPEWDGHKPSDITRLLNLLNKPKNNELTVEVKATEIDEVKDIITSFIFMLEDSRIDIRIREQYLESCKYLKDNFFVNTDR